VLRAPELTGHLSNEGALVATSTPDEFREYVQSEIAHWQKIITDLGFERAS
jgi:tripartite-type tricarboxylate transporter receptor subunit TctC